MQSHFHTTSVIRRHGGHFGRVSFTPQSRHAVDGLGCLLSARCRHGRRERTSGIVQFRLGVGAGGQAHGKDGALARLARHVPASAFADARTDNDLAPFLHVVADAFTQASGEPGLHSVLGGVVRSRGRSRVRTWSAGDAAGGRASNRFQTLSACKIRLAIASGCEIRPRWLASISIVFAPMRLAMKRSRSGFMVRSWLDTA